MQITPIIFETYTPYRDPMIQIDDYLSFIWTDRYYTPGDFEMCVPATEKNLQWIKLGYLVGRMTDGVLEGSCGIIEYIQKSMDEYGSARILVRGRFIGGFLYQRVIASQTILSTTSSLKSVIETLCDENVFNPSKSARYMHTFSVSQTGETGPNVNNLQWTGQNLGESISAICEAHHIGWKVERASDGEYVLSLYEGLDRTISQSTNTWAVFSDEDGSLLTLTYSEDTSAKVNSVRIAGEGEGSDRRIMWVDIPESTSEGYTRHEVWVDARDIQSNNGEVSDADYQEMLENRAKGSFTDSEFVLEATAAFVNLRYKTDVSLGDLCTIRCKSLGIEIDARLVEVIESIDETGRYSAVPTFSI